MRLRPPDTPTLDAIAPTLTEWQAHNTGQPVLAVDPTTYLALTDECLQLLAWRGAEREQMPPAPSGLVTYAGHEVAVTPDVDGWEWRAER